MEPTTLIVTALATGATLALKAALGEAAKDTYKTLKKRLLEKYGHQADVKDAVKKLEDKPDSAGRKATLEEEITAAKADHDPEILAAAQALLDQIKAQPGGEQHIQQVTGSSYVAQADRGATATVRVTK